MAAPKRKRVMVLCLGDVGRSPRMQFHALSLANIANLDVDLVGYPGKLRVARALRACCAWLANSCVCFEQGRSATRKCARTHTFGSAS